MSEIEDALNATAEIIKTIPATNPPGSRVWVHPGDSRSIQTNAFPFVVVTKMNNEVGSWYSESFGEGSHKWSILIAVYIVEGPITVTSSDEITLNAIENAHEWYKLMSDLLYQNMKLSGTVNIIGDQEGKLFDYVTENILWDGTIIDQMDNI